MVSFERGTQRHIQEHYNPSHIQPLHQSNLSKLQDETVARNSQHTGWKNQNYKIPYRPERGDGSDMMKLSKSKRTVLHLVNCAAEWGKSRFSWTTATGSRGGQNGNTISGCVSRILVDSCYPGQTQLGDCVSSRQCHTEALEKTEQGMGPPPPMWGMDEGRAESSLNFFTGHSTFPQDNPTSCLNWNLDFPIFPPNLFTWLLFILQGHKMSQPLFRSSSSVET